MVKNASDTFRRPQKCLDNSGVRTLSMVKTVLLPQVEVGCGRVGGSRVAASASCFKSRSSVSYLLKRKHENNLSDYDNYRTRRHATCIEHG